jgi:hypothetical protein
MGEWPGCTADLLQTARQIVDASAAILLFAPGKRMNQGRTEAELLNSVGRANSFRACFRYLVDPLLTAERVVGLFMIASIKLT